MTAADNLTARIAEMTCDQIRDTMCSLMTDFSPEADAVFSACMKAAEARLPSAEFVALCGQLEAALPRCPSIADTPAAPPHYHGHGGPRRCDATTTD